MLPIIIPFTPNSLGRVKIRAQVMTGDRKSLKDVDLKYDSGSDFTTISCDDLDNLGFSEEFLKSCPHHEGGASLAAGDKTIPLQYITNVSIKFGDRELQHCRVFFALGTTLRSLFGSDILKYFNREICYDSGELRLFERKDKPTLSTGETPIQIYSVEQT
ncbi:MAG: retroviral-like aspartic protease family protein [Oscillospiraceae bacterium]|nr:retroviral-like aspartic protease family protein [Oscillospiraceae bacterium]